MLIGQAWLLGDIDLANNHAGRLVRSMGVRCARLASEDRPGHSNAKVVFANSDSADTTPRSEHGPSINMVLVVVVIRVVPRIVSSRIAIGDS